MDLILPADSAKFIAENSKNVSINKDGVIELAKIVNSYLEAGDLSDFSYGDDGLHPRPSDPNVIDWIFVIDTLNFCFWTPPGVDKWSVNGHTGYYGLTAAIKRAINEGVDITNPQFYSKITEDELKHVLRADNGVTEAPLIPTRVQCLHEVGKTLIDRFDGTFKSCIESADKSAIKLLQIIIDNFPCYRDESLFNDRRVTFYKRAQILISDVWACFDGKDVAEFYDIDKLTMFADYRVPQALVHFKVLEYTDELMDMLKQNKILENGSSEEAEIRGCSIHAVELINDAVRALSKPGVDVKINSVLIDYFLWIYRRKNAADLEQIPFHKVYCKFY